MTLPSHSCLKPQSCIAQHLQLDIEQSATPCASCHMLHAVQLSTLLCVLINLNSFHDCRAEGLYAWLQVKLPLEVGTFMECEWKQGQYHRAKIIERRKRSDAPDYEYYVHYIGCECLSLTLPYCPTFLPAAWETKIVQ